jgi:hypothetical protein
MEEWKMDIPNHPECFEKWREMNSSDANHPKCFDDLSQEEKLTLTSWVPTYLDPIKSFNERHTSYGMKHRFENYKDGFYITNGAFKGAMIDCGFKGKD